MTQELIGPTQFAKAKSYYSESILLALGVPESKLASLKLDRHGNWGEGSDHWPSSYWQCLALHQAIFNPDFSVITVS